VSGFICDDVDEMVAAVGRVSEIDPEECRRQAARFGADVMCAGYLDIYRSVCGSPGQAARRSVPAGAAASAGG
jgi:hypothetical protein